MPIKGATYAIKKTSKGPVRLAFKKGKVVEAKNMKTKKTHTQAEFRSEAKKMAKRRSSMKSAMRSGAVRVSMMKPKTKSKKS